MVAAILDRDEGAGAVLRNRGCFAGDVPGARIELGPIRHQSVDFGHGGKLVALDIGGAAGHQQPRIGMGAPRAADRLPRLAHRLAGYRAAIDHHQVAFLRQHRADLFAFGNVQPAAERDNLRLAHAKSSHSKLPR